MRSAVEARGLVKRYGRDVVALKGLDLTVEQGEIFGFLGPNGAGKSTTIRILVDLLRPTSGTVRVLGRDPRGAVNLRRDVGYLAGDFLVDGRQTGRELVTYLGNLRGGVSPARVNGLAERLDLDLDRRFGGLSKGNKQKLGLVQAFMHTPKLLILDEPTSGLDPFLQRQFAELAREAKGNGQTVFMSSHVMSEVQQVCDRVGIIREGALTAVERIEELRQRAVRKVEIHFASHVDSMEFDHIAGVHDVAVEDHILRCSVEGAMDTFVKAVSRHEVVDFVSEEPELEELFFSYYARETL